MCFVCCALAVHTQVQNLISFYTLHDTFTVHFTWFIYSAFYMIYLQCVGCACRGSESSGLPVDLWTQDGGGVCRRGRHPAGHIAQPNTTARYLWVGRGKGGFACTVWLIFFRNIHKRHWYSVSDLYCAVIAILYAILSHHQTYNIRWSLVGNKIVDYSDVVGASPVGAAPTTSSFSTWTPSFNGLGKDNCKTKGKRFKFWDLVWTLMEPNQKQIG